MSADITMCSGKDCPKKETCYRYLATPTRDWQSYFETPPYDLDKHYCPDYWPVNTEMSVKWCRPMVGQATYNRQTLVQSQPPLIQTPSGQSTMSICRCKSQVNVNKCMGFVKCEICKRRQRRCPNAYGEWTKMTPLINK